MVQSSHKTATKAAEFGSLNLEFSYNTRRFASFFWKRIERSVEFLLAASAGHTVDAQDKMLNLKQAILDVNIIDSGD